MVVRDRADGVEAAQVVFERVIVSMPGHDVEGGMFEFCREELVVEFADDGVFRWCFLVIKGCDGGLEVASICETVGANGS